MYYRLKQVGFDGVFEYSKTINIQITEQSNASTIKVFPNPSSGLIMIQTTSERLIQIQNLYGQIIRQQIINSNQQIDLSSLEAGIYFRDYHEN